MIILCTKNYEEMGREKKNWKSVEFGWLYIAATPPNHFPIINRPPKMRQRRKKRRKVWV